MNRISLAFIRLFFFVMLFVSTACNKMDRSLHTDDFAEAKPAVAAQADDSERIRLLESRVAQLEADLETVNHEAKAAADIPGGANWD